MTARARALVATVAAQLVHHSKGGVDEHDVNRAVELARYLVRVVEDSKAHHDGRPANGYVYRPMTPPLTLSGLTAYMGGLHTETIIAIQGDGGAVRGAAWARYDGHAEDRPGVIVLSALPESRGSP